SLILSMPSSKYFSLTIIFPDSGLSDKALAKIYSILSQVNNFYLDTISSFYKNDLDKADKASAKRKAVLRLCSDFLMNSRSHSQRGMASRMMYMISFVNSASRITRYISFEKHNIVKGQIILSKI
ncbi:MAG: hypothetical protein AABX96_01245, partial [Nanoarchaeota archaeon]